MKYRVLYSLYPVQAQILDMPYSYRTIIKIRQEEGKKPPIQFDKMCVERNLCETVFRGRLLLAELSLFLFDFLDLRKMWPLENCVRGRSGHKVRSCIIFRHRFEASFIAGLEGSLVRLNRSRHSFANLAPPRMDSRPELAHFSEQGQSRFHLLHIP